MAPRLTAVRRSRPGRVALELDGRPWRVVPDAVVVRCGLAAGLELDRPLLRELRRALRQVEAFDVAARALGRRDISQRRLAQRLEARGIAPPERAGTVAALAETGLVDDGRSARARAAWLGERGWGDAAIEARLEAEGFEAGPARAALAELAPEHERATVAAARHADRRKAWAHLRRRGFSAEAIESALGTLDEEAEPG